MCGPGSACLHPGRHRRTRRCRSPGRRHGRNAPGHRAARRLRQARQPAYALLLLDRHPRRIDVPLQFVCVIKRFAAPELDGGKAKRQSFRRDHETLCISSPHCVWVRGLPLRSHPIVARPIRPIISGLAQAKLNAVVSWITRTSPEWLRRGWRLPGSAPPGSPPHRTAHWRESDRPPLCWPNPGRPAAKGPPWLPPIGGAVDAGDRGGACRRVHTLPVQRRSRMPPAPTTPEPLPLARRAVADITASRHATH